jgi:hypothetical protein
VVGHGAGVDASSHVDLALTADIDLTFDTAGLDSSLLCQGLELLGEGRGLGSEGGLDGSRFIPIFYAFASSSG